MTVKRLESSPEEVIALLPVLRQDVPTVTGLRAELRLLRRLTILPMAMGILAMGTLLGVGGLMMALMKVFPALESPSNTGMQMGLTLWFTVIAIGFVGSFTLQAILPPWIDRRLRGREAVFCDVQLIGDLLDLGKAIQTTDSGSRKGWRAGCVSAWLKRTLPEIGALEAAALTDEQRDALVEIALKGRSAEEPLALAALHSAPIWGDLDTLAAVRMLAETADSDAIRAAAHASFSPLSVRLLAGREDATLIDSLRMPSATS